MVDINTILAGVKFKTPVVLASGILGVTGSSLVNVARNGAGGVITKSISLEPRKGHNCPVVIAMDNYMINAVGLSNAGVEESIKEIMYAKKNTDAIVIASIFASNVEDFGKVAKEISKAKPDMIEINISCPNVADEFGKPFSTDPKLSGDVVRIVKNNTDIPIITKLSPNVANIQAIAKAVEEAGTDAISAINTIGPGMEIDIHSRKLILQNKVGGVSGPAIKSIAVRYVYQIYEAVKVPILGVGGISTAEDAIEMMMAGASAVAVGSAVYYEGIGVFKKINEGIIEFMEKNGYKDLKEIIGAAHE
jgi:dihydroorotate dehydrogenase (NAD+) catalytic subunit